MVLKNIKKEECIIDLSGIKEEHQEKIFCCLSEGLKEKGISYIIEE